MLQAIMKVEDRDKKYSKTNLNNAYSFWLMRSPTLHSHSTDHSMTDVAVGCDGFIGISNSAQAKYRMLMVAPTFKI